MEDRLHTRDIPIAHRINGRTAPGATLSRLLQSLYKDAEWMQEEELSLALDTYFQTLATWLNGETPLPRSAADLSRRILQFIDAHLSEPMLGPSEVAAVMGISVRHLHRIVAGNRTTLGDYVRMRRLEQCRVDLANPSLQSRTITDIAFCHGFSDAAHFSHLFRKHFGISARAFRAQFVVEEQSTKTPHVEVRYPNTVRQRESQPN
jgi:AraC-like DNA-binding protein